MEIFEYDYGSESDYDDELDFIECEVCQKQIKFSKYEKHQKRQCKGRLHKCRVCHKDIQHWLWQDHINNCNKEAARCNKCHKYMKNTELEDHMIAHQFESQEESKH